MNVLLALAVVGSIQFWERTCDANLRCTLPVARGPRHPVASELTRPSAPGQLAQYKVTVEDAGLSAELQLLWALPPDGSESYLASQARLADGGKPVVECTQYAKDDVERWFPVGACAGYVPSGEGYRELGVTFYKDAR